MVIAVITSNDDEEVLGSNQDRQSLAGPVPKAFRGAFGFSARFRVEPLKSVPPFGSNLEEGRGSMKAQLLVVEGKPLGAMIPLNGPTYFIGRDPACHLRPKNESVGERHCRLSIGDGRVSVADLGSPGGTLLNGRRLPPTEETRADHGDRLQIGNLVFELSIFHPQTAAVAAPAPPVVQKSPSLLPSLTPEPNVTIKPTSAPPYPLADEDVDDEFDSRAAMLANRLIQRTLGGGTDPMKALGTHLHAHTVDGLPCVSIEMSRIAGDEAIIPLRRELRDLAERPGISRVVLDFHRVRSISPEGADVFVHFLKRLQLKKVKVHICEVDPTVLAVLESRGFLVPTFLDAHDAVWSSW